MLGVTLAEPDRIAKVASELSALGAPCPHRRHTRYRNHRCDWFRYTYSGLPRRICRYRHVLRYLWFPDHVIRIAGQLLNGCFSATEFLRAENSPRPPAIASRYRRHDGRRAAVSAAAARGPRTSEIRSGDCCDGFKLLLQLQRRLFFATGGDQSAAAHMVARGWGAILFTGAGFHGRRSFGFAARRNRDGMRALCVSGVAVILVSHIIMAILS